MWSECWPASRLTFESCAWAAKRKAPSRRSLMKRGQDFALVATPRACTPKWTCWQAIWVPVCLLYINSDKPAYIASPWEPHFPIPVLFSWLFTSQVNWPRQIRTKLSLFSRIFFSVTIWYFRPPARQSGTLGPSLLLRIFANSPQHIWSHFSRISDILKLLKPPKTCFLCSNKTSAIERLIGFHCPNFFSRLQYEIKLNLVRLKFSSIGFRWPRRSVRQDLAKVELFKLFHAKEPRILQKLVFYVQTRLRKSNKGLRYQKM